VSACARAEAGNGSNLVDDAAFVSVREIFAIGSILLEGA
jgi:hypothetical protein